MSDSLPQTLPIRLARNGSWSRTLLIEDELGAPVDLTGVTFAGQVRAVAGASGAALATIDIDVIDAAGGQILATLLGSQLDAVEGPMETVRLAHDIIATKAGVPSRIAVGPVILDPEVTQ